MRGAAPFFQNHRYATQFQILIKYYRIIVPERVLVVPAAAITGGRGPPARLTNTSSIEALLVPETARRHEVPERPRPLKGGSKRGRELHPGAPYPRFSPLRVVELADKLAFT